MPMHNCAYGTTDAQLNIWYFKYVGMLYEGMSIYT